MDFSKALSDLKNGGRVARAGWNGKGMFLFFIPVWTYTDGKQDNFPNDPFIAMKTAGGTVVPWLASQTDLLATDWEGVPSATTPAEPIAITAESAIVEEIKGLVPGRVAYYTPSAEEPFIENGGPIVADIVRVWDTRSDSGCCNLRLKCDGTNQNPTGAVEWVTSRHYDPTGKPGTWRFLR